MKRDNSKRLGKAVCGGCGRSLRGSRVMGLARQAYVRTPQGFRVHLVCDECAGRGLLIVTPEPAEQARDVLRPFAEHLRRLAKPYEMNGDGRAVGLLQAADVLESGRAVAIDVAPRAPAANGSPTYRVGPLAEEVIALTRIEPAPLPAKKPAAGAELELGGCELALLSVLLHQRSPITRDQLGLRAGYSVTSGSYSTALSRLRELGLISGPSRAIVSSPEGVRRVADTMYQPPLVPAELVGYWAEKVGGAAGTILLVATAAYPNALSREELAERAGYSPTSGSYSTTLGRLRSLHLLDGCRASDALMTSAKLAPYTHKEAHGSQTKNEG